MGDSTLVTQVTGNTITVDGVNQYKSALSGHSVPRNTAGAAAWLGIAYLCGKNGEGCC